MKAKTTEAKEGAPPPDEGATCRAGSDGECCWKKCPQTRDNEPQKTGRSCPLPHWTDDEDY